MHGLIRERHGPLHHGLIYPRSCWSRSPTRTRCQGPLPAWQAGCPENSQFHSEMSPRACARREEGREGGEKSKPGVRRFRVAVVQHRQVPTKQPGGWSENAAVHTWHSEHPGLARARLRRASRGRGTEQQQSGGPCPAGFVPWLLEGQTQAPAWRWHGSAVCGRGASFAVMSS